MQHKTIPVVLIRHAQSQWNQENRFIGWVNPPLTAAGEAFWKEQITPRIHKGERVLIRAHGNTLRALIMDLAEMSVEQVESFEIPTATPIVNRFDSNAKPLDWCYLDMTAASAKSA